MRTTHTAAYRRRLAIVVPAGLTLIAMAALAGCSGSAANSQSAANGAVAEPAAIPSAAASASAERGPAGFGGAVGSGGSGGSAQDASAARLAPGSQQLIYTAKLTVRARDVATAVARATSIATSAGGYVSTEDASSDPGHPDGATATIELKIPVAMYGTTLTQLSTGLGTQLSLQQQAQDVTEQVADVDSRVVSDEAAIAQLRALLKHAGSVSDLLTVQDQINGEETDLESLQAQQSALDHETSYATVKITVVGPQAPKTVAKAAKPKPPPGFAGGLSGGWRAFRATVSWSLAILGAIGPFAVFIALLGGLTYWIRRRLAHRGQPGSS